MSGMVLASGLMHLLIKALTHTLKPWFGLSLAWPGANFGTITNQEMLRGFGHLWTTGVLLVEPLMTFAVSDFPSQFMDLTVGNFLEPFAYSGSSS
jgi:hypothetical protein